MRLFSRRAPREAAELDAMMQLNQARRVFEVALETQTKAERAMIDAGDAFRYAQREVRRIAETKVAPNG